MKYWLSILLTFSFLWADGISFQLLNDEAYGTDQELTGGFEILYQPLEYWSFYLAEELYTPTNTDTLTPIDGERPYNAWLYMGVLFQHEMERIDILTSFSLDIGTVGPRAMGKELQNGIHKIIGVDGAEGWDSQTSNRYDNIVGFKLEHSLLEYLNLAHEQNFHFSVNLTAEGGTLKEAYGVGAGIALGSNVPFYNSLVDFPQKYALYIFANAHYAHVAKNRLLEGNDVYNVIREDSVQKYDVGLNWDYEAYRIRVIRTRMTKEYTTQAREHDFMRIEFTVGF